MLPSHVGSTFDLRLLPSLRSLSFTQIQMSVGREFLGARLVGFLTCIPDLIDLEDLYFEVEAHTTWPQGIDWSVWSDLDGLLTASELQHFRRLTLDVCLHSGNNHVACAPDAPAAKSELARLSAAMPKLFSRGLLHVHLIPALTSYSRFQKVYGLNF